MLRLLLLFPAHLQVQHTTDGGWEQPQIKPFGPLQLHPAAQVLHYGTCCFEGMKAYLGPDGRGLLFRWDEEAASRIILAA
jgi:branched-chain amino acid aminotransferase